MWETSAKGTHRSSGRSEVSYVQSYRIVPRISWANDSSYLQGHVDSNCSINVIARAIQDIGKTHQGHLLGREGERREGRGGEGRREEREGESEGKVFRLAKRASIGHHFSSVYSSIVISMVATSAFLMRRRFSAQKCKFLLKRTNLHTR